MSIELDNERRQQKTLYFSLIVMLSATVLTIIILVASDFFFSRGFSQFAWCRNTIEHSCIGILLFLVGSLVLLFLNRVKRISSIVARHSFVGLVLISVIICDTPKNVVSRGLVMFALPIILGSVLVHPTYSFMVATTSSVLTAFIDTQLLGNIPNLIAILIFYMIAAISWLATKTQRDAIQNLQELNTKLNTRVERQNQDLLQINDHAFLAHSHGNAIVLFSPSKECIFANDPAMRAREQMDDETLLRWQATVERAWQKNTYTRINFNGDSEFDIVSSLIDTAEGTYLLVQAIRSFDQETQRSLTEWQQKLTAVHGLPENAEYDARTRKMRATLQDSSGFNRKVIFELDLDGNLIIENPLNRQQRLEFNLKDLWALAVRG